MPLLLAITVIIQACFIYHVFKTGRPYWWAFIILSMPVLGSIIYYFVEVFPGSREHRSAHKAATKLSKTFAGDRDLRARMADAEHCASIDNRIALARECAERGLHHEAADLYRSCLEGPYANDPALLLGLTRALIEDGRFDEARERCTHLIKEHPEHKPVEVKLARARILDGLGEPDMALAEYRELVPTFTGFEARYRYAELLARLGHAQQSALVIKEILAQARRNPPALDTEQAWVTAAKRLAVGGG
jgi:hypothetical protein